MTERNTPLTDEDIQILPEELRPGYVGEDEEGRYKINEFGEKRRPFQKGGPSPNPKGRFQQPRPYEKGASVQEMAEATKWVTPCEFYMAILNKDYKFLTKIQTGSPEGLPDTPPELITLKDQMEAAAKLLPHQLPRASRPKKSSGESSEDEDFNNTGQMRPSFEIGGPSRRDLS